MAKDNSMFTFKTMYHIIVSALDYSNHTMGLPEMRLMMKEETFDLVITSVFGGRMQSGLAAHFGCPLAYIFPVKTTLNTAYFMGNPIQLATVPSILSSIRNPMGFMDRVKSFLITAFEFLFFAVFDAIEWYYYNSNFQQPNYPSYMEASRNASLVLSASTLARDRSRMSRRLWRSVGSKWTRNWTHFRRTWRSSSKMLPRE